MNISITLCNRARAAVENRIKSEELNMERGKWKREKVWEGTRERERQRTGARKVDK